MDLCLTVFNDFDTVKSFFENVKRGIRCMNFKIFLTTQKTHSQVYTPREQVELNPVIPVPGQAGKINMCISIDPEVILFAKMNLCPAFSGTKLVIYDDRKINRSLLISLVGSSLNKHITGHITHPRKAIVIVFRTVIRVAEEGKTEQETHNN
jgi:hypothetical protein